MTFARFGLLAASWVSTAGCGGAAFDFATGGPGFVDTGRVTQAPTEPAGPSDLQVDSVLGGCEGATDRTLAFEILTNGWVDTMVFHIHRSVDSRHESHPTVLQDTDPGGDWDRWAMGPLSVGQADPYVPGVTSALDCATDALGHAVLLFDDSGVVVACAVWGEEPKPMEALLRRLNPAVDALGACQRF